MSRTVMELTRRGIRQRNPNADADELAVEFVAICYGPALAARLRLYLQMRHRSRESDT